MDWIELTPGHENEALHMGLEYGDEVLVLKTHKKRSQLKSPATWTSSGLTDVFRVVVINRDNLLVRHDKASHLRYVIWRQVLGFRKAAKPSPDPEHTEPTP
jgi:hypothetical protein